MRIAVLRHLGLPLDAALAAHAGVSTKGKVLDAYGDTAQNDGRAGHAGRHKTLLTTFVKVLRSVWGQLVEQEPTDHFSYSTYQPDVAAAGYSRIGRSGKRLVADLKLLDDLSSNPADIGLRGTRIGFGNTKPGIEAKV